MKRLARTDIAIQTRQLCQQAVWCGIVSGLAATLLILNLMPPVEISYLVTGKVLTSTGRAESLRDSIDSSAESVGEPSVRAVRILDRSKQTLSVDAGPQAVLLGVDCVWNRRCDQEQFRGWIEALTSNSRTAVVQSTPEANEARFVQWQLDAARHYLNHQEYLGLDAKTNGNVFQLASTGSSGEATPAQLKLDMAQKVTELETKLAKLKQNSPTLQPMGKAVELTDDPIVQPHCRKIPVWMALSVIVLGIAVGSSAGWLQMRLHSGGVFDPTDVADQLAKAGIPKAASLQLSLDVNESSDWISYASLKASEASRKGGRNLILLSEAALAFWCLLIANRICLDPLWRGLLLDSPLAALARLFSGMP